MNIYDIAEKAGVSPSTVSRVLNDRGNVKESTKKKVLRIIEEENYIPSALARNLSVGECRNIAFLAPDIENPFFSKILHGISNRASQTGYGVFMFGTDEEPEREHQVLDSLLRDKPGGLIVIPVQEHDRLTAEKLKTLESEGIPVVLVDRDFQDASLDGVFSEDFQGARKGVACLIQAGHKKIGMIGGPVTSRPGRERRKGYETALREHDIRFREEYMVDGNFMEETSYQAMKKLMELTDPPTAVFTANNMATLGCLKYMKENDLKLVRDLALVGFDDIPELQYTDIQLTVVTRPIYDMGWEAMRLMEQRLKDKKELGKNRKVVQRIMVRTGLVVRGSEAYPIGEGGTL